MSQAYFMTALWAEDLARSVTKMVYPSMKEVEFDSSEAVNFTREEVDESWLGGSFEEYGLGEDAEFVVYTFSLGDDGAASVIMNGDQSSAYSVVFTDDESAVFRIVTDIEPHIPLASDPKYWSESQGQEVSEEDFPM